MGITKKSLQDTLKAFWDKVNIKITEQVTALSDKMNRGWISDEAETATSGKLNVYDSSLYSTEERIIGQWTDGRPLYQKAIQTTMPTVTKAGTAAGKTIEYPSGVTIDNIVKIECLQFKQRNSSSVSVSFHGKWVTGSYNMNVTAQPSGLLLSANTPDWSNQSVCIIIQYTKSTDSAVDISKLRSPDVTLNFNAKISSTANNNLTKDANGLYVPKYVGGNGITVSGNTISANTYSTDEQIVGTWIDGKPIYQKSYNISLAVSTEVDKTYDPGVNIGKLIDLKYMTHLCGANNNYYDILGNWCWGTGNKDYFIYNATDKKFHYLIGKEWKAGDINSYILVTIQYTK